MTIADQTTTGVDRNLPTNLPADVFATHLRKRGRASLSQLRAFARLGEAENFVSDDLSDRETIVDFRALHIARFQIRHGKGLLRRFARSGEGGCVFLLEREIIGRVTKTEQMGRL